MDLVQSVIVTSRPQSVAQDYKQEGKVCNDWCFGIFLLDLTSSYSLSPAPFPASFFLWNPRGQVSVMPAFQMCVMTNSMQRESIRLRQECLARNVHSLGLTCTELSGHRAHWWMNVFRLFWVFIYITYRLEWLGNECSNQMGLSGNWASPISGSPGNWFYCNCWTYFLK